MKKMKKQIFITLAIILMSLTLKSQQLQILNDTNVIFYDFVPDTSISFDTNNTLNLDINHDNIFDLQFNFVNNSSYLNAYIRVMNSNCMLSFLYTAMNNDTLTNNLIVWRSGNNFWNSYDCPEKIGIRFTNGNTYYYGWIRAYINAGAVFVDKYAFCKIPNYPFLYGQTEIITNISTPDTIGNTSVYLSNSGSIISIQSEKIIKQVKLTSSLGATIAIQNNVNSNSASISTSGLAHGTYIVRVQFFDHTFYTTQIVL